jgi:hypothetical protein
MGWQFGPNPRQCSKVDGGAGEPGDSSRVNPKTRTGGSVEYESEDCNKGQLSITFAENNKPTSKYRSGLKSG